MGEAATLSTRGSGFQIDRRQDRGGYVLRLTGRLDLHAAALLRAEISQVLTRSAPPSWLKLDMDRVTSMDRLGLGTLVVARRICAAMGVRLTVNSPPGTVKAPEAIRPWDISARPNSGPLSKRPRHAASTTSPGRTAQTALRETGSMNPGR